jgi:hypothetical protein
MLIFTLKEEGEGGSGEGGGRRQALSKYNQSEGM